MKKLFFTLFVLSTFAVMQAQEFGIKAGVNFAGLKGNNADAYDGITSFHAGVVSEFRIFDNLSLQPEFLYSTQGAKLGDDEYKLNYFNVPILLKFYLNDALSIQAGPQFGILVGETKEFKFNDTNTYDFGLAGGIEYFLTNGLFAQARYTVGSGSISDNVDIKNTVIQLSLGYMF